MVNIINNINWNTYIYMYKYDFEAEIKFKYVKMEECEKKIVIIGEETSIEISKKSEFPLYYSEEKEYMEIHLNNNVYLIGKNINKDNLEAIINNSLKNEDAISVNEDDTLKNKETILEKIHKNHRSDYYSNTQGYINSLVKKEGTFHIYEMNSVFNRIFASGNNYYITELHHSYFKKIVTIIIDNIRIKITNMKNDKTMPYGLIWPEFKNKEFKVKYEASEGIGLVNRDFYKFANINLFYEAKNEQLAIKFNDLFIIDIFGVKPKEFLKLVYLRETIKEEEILEYEAKAEIRSSLPEYYLRPGDPGYEFSPAEAIDNWLDY